MPASIRITLHQSPGGPVVGPVLVDQSRDDLRKGYQVVLESVNVHTTYSWAISFKPESPDRTDSSAALLPPEGSTSSVAKFNVDYEGAYLIRLVADAGLPTEDTKYLRLRFVTRFGNIKLVAAGERRDENGVIPMDATPEGWTNDQNQNLQLLLAQVRRQATTGRVLWVDANRGRDSANNINDPANSYQVPGSDPADTADETTFTAEAHGDFATVNEAISYAFAAPARGEPAPSATDPYFIRIKPGLYTEDVNLYPHIHLVGDDWSRQARDSYDGTMPVIIRTVNAAGGTHTYYPADPSGLCFLTNIAFENTAVTAQPVIKHSNGLLFLFNCTVTQRANGATQGAAVESISTKLGEPVHLNLSGCKVRSFANADDARWALIFDSEAASESALSVNFSSVEGRSAISFNQSNYAGSGARISGSFVSAELGYAIRSGGSLGIDSSQIESGDLAKNILVDGFLAGAGANPGDVSVSVRNSGIGRVIFDKTFVGGNSNWRGGGVSTASSSDEWLQAPGGALSETSATMTARSIEWHQNWRLPEDQPAGPETTPAHSEFPYHNVQDVLDLLANIVNPQGAQIGGPWPNTGGLTLNAAYDGIQSYSPFVSGAGLGRFILADNGSVQILGALAPSGSGVVDPAQNGGLQVEGVVDIGPIVGDGYGSEIYMEPNPFGYGPRVTLGRNIWNNELTTLDRSPASVISGGSNPEGNYNLWLVAQGGQDSGTGFQGHIVLSAGRTKAGGPALASGGDVFIQAGDVAEPTAGGIGGYVWLTPGYTDGGPNGRIAIVRPNPVASPGMSIRANQQYAVSGPIANDGTLHLATPAQSFAIPLAAGDLLADIVTKINAITLGEIIASDDAGHLKLEAGLFGKISELFVVGVSALSGGTDAQFFTELGEIRESVALGVTTKGVTTEFAELECTGHTELTIHGTLKTLSTITDAVYQSYQQEDTNTWGGVPHQHQLSTVYGVDASVVGGTIELDGFSMSNPPNTIRVFTIKREDGNPGGTTLTLLDVGGATIDGSATYTLTFPYESVDLYWNGTAWFTK